MAPVASGGRSQSRGLARPPTPASGWPVPVLARRRHEIAEPVEKLKRREVDDAIGPRPRGLAAATALSQRMIVISAKTHFYKTSHIWRPQGRAPQAS